MNINLELYKIFYYVAKNGSISRTANELLISQPAISKSIKNLEEQIDAKLFIRKRDGVELTEIGTSFYKKIKDAMELIDSAENDLNVLTNMESGIINIGASKTILHEYLMKYIKEFHQKYPKVSIRIFTDNTNELIRRSKIGLIDVIFANCPVSVPNEFDEFKVMDLHDCFVVNKDYDYLLDKKISKKEFEKLPLLVLTKGANTRIRLDNYCTENKININPEMEFSGNTIIKDFTEAGFGVGMLTEEHVKDELEQGKLFKLDIDLKLEPKYLGMIWNKENKSLVSKNFIAYIKNNVND